MKKLFFKYKEIIMYLIFGVLTTVVGMGSYFLILFLARTLGTDPESAAYNGVRVFAQIAQWVLAVTFAYYTNKRWVFGVKEKKGDSKRLAAFFCSRLFSLGCDSLVTFATIFILATANYETLSLSLPLGISLPLSADLWAKLAASVVVIVVNYVLSKFLIFKRK